MAQPQLMDPDLVWNSAAQNIQDKVGASLHQQWKLTSLSATTKSYKTALLPATHASHILQTRE